MILQKMNYTDHDWINFWDLKVVDDDLNKEQEEQCYLDTKVIYKPYQGWCNINIMDYAEQKNASRHRKSNIGNGKP